MVIRPPLGCSRPAMQRIVLVLPQPDWPSRTSDSPSAICRSSSFTTVLPLYCRLRFSRVIFIGLSSPARRSHRDGSAGTGIGAITGGGRQLGGQATVIAG